MKVYDVEITFGTGDDITIEVEAENEEEALQLAIPTYFQIVGEN